MSKEDSKSLDQPRLQMDPDRNNAAAFTAEWQAVERQIRRICCRQLDAIDDLDELIQLTAIRAWRAYSQFRRQSTFLTWVVAIARRQAMRLNHHRHQRLARQINLDSVMMLPAADVTVTPSRWMCTAFAAARSAGVLSEKEAAVVEAQLAVDDWVCWRDVGRSLGLGEAECALHFSRAIPKLRVYLFVAMPSALGGRDAIERAFQFACTNQESPLTKTEADVFRHQVLNGNPPLRRSGWQAAMRGACAKVIRYIGMEDPGRHSAT